MTKPKTGKKADLETQHLVTELENENLKLQKQIAKLTAQNVTLKNKITLLEKEKQNMMAAVAAAMNEKLPEK